MMMQRLTGHRPLLYNASAMCKHTEFSLQSMQHYAAAADITLTSNRTLSYKCLQCTITQYPDSEPDRTI